MTAAEAREAAEKASKEIVIKDIEQAAKSGLTSYSTHISLSKDFIEELQNDGYTVKKTDWGEATKITQSVAWNMNFPILTKIEW